MIPDIIDRGVAIGAKRGGGPNAGVDLEIYEVFRASFLKADAKYISSRLIVLAPHIVGPVGCPASACISLHFQPLQHLHT